MRRTATPTVRLGGSFGDFVAAEESYRPLSASDVIARNKAIGGS